eukprot:4856615-Amphidinium_carterae.1
MKGLVSMCGTSLCLGGLASMDKRALGPLAQDFSLVSKGVCLHKRTLCQKGVAGRLLRRVFLQWVSKSAIIKIIG